MTRPSRVLVSAWLLVACRSPSAVGSCGSTHSGDAAGSQAAPAPAPSAEMLTSCELHSARRHYCAEGIASSLLVRDMMLTCTGPDMTRSNGCPTAGLVGKCTSNGFSDCYYPNPASNPGGPTAAELAKTCKGTWNAP